MRVAAVVNPKSSGGQTAALWPRLEAALRERFGAVETHFTDAPLAATALTARALDNGADLIIAVGGDGTVNEAVNGFFDPTGPRHPEAALAMLTSGTGGDFRKTFGLPSDPFEQIAGLAAGQPHPIDIGRIDYIDHDGREAVRYFNNIASFGLSGEVVATVNRQRLLKRLGGRIAFHGAMLQATLRHRLQEVRLEVDDHHDARHRFNTIAVANGRFFGGGMVAAPEARPDSGHFEVVLLGDTGKAYMLFRANRFYSGAYHEEDFVTVLRGRRIVATPVGPGDTIRLDVDGEGPGRLPATFTILPGALKLWY